MPNEKSSSKVKGSPLETMVLSTVIIGSAKNADFRLALMSTAVGNFSVNTNENPEMVDLIGKLREGDNLKMEVLSPFGYTKRPNPAGGDDIIDVACTKFRITEVEGGEETQVKGLDNRKIKGAIIGKGKSTATGDALKEGEETRQEEDRG